MIRKWAWWSKAMTTWIINTWSRSWTSSNPSTSKKSAWPHNNRFDQPPKNSDVPHRSLLEQSIWQQVKRPKIRPPKKVQKTIDPDPKSWIITTVLVVYLAIRNRQENILPTLKS